MKIFVFDRIDQVSESYHPEGGLVIVAKNVDHARSLIADREHIKPTEEEWASAVEYGLDHGVDYDPVVYVFPDAGCC